MWPHFQPEPLSGAISVVNPNTNGINRDQVFEECGYDKNDMPSKYRNKKSDSIHEKETFFCE